MSSSAKKIVRARDAMRAGVITIDGLATAKEAVARMREHQINSLLVEKRHADDVWGIVTIRDLIQGVIVPGRPAVDVNVFEVMTKPIVMVPADMDIRYVARLLHRTRLSQVPVEHFGELLGMISLSSLVLHEDIF
ncbi:MAG: histidine kinase [Desulfobulbaceae bacterium A2]|nr:MAG: histidine kinase [Desulfobulbaceae bacterium A2]